MFCQILMFVVCVDGILLKNVIYQFMLPFSGSVFWHQDSRINDFQSFSCFILQERKYFEG